ncbi:MAG: MerR family transcriptional regulator [Acidimicrobiales bacterium]
MAIAKTDPSWGEPSQDGAGEEFTAAELARRGNVTVRTIRYYQSSGILPMPHRQGRNVVYGPRHLQRLEFIAELARRGLRLSAIAEIIAQSEATGASASEWLGLGDVLVRPWSEDRPALWTEAELSEHMDGSTRITPADLEASGLIERRRDTSPLTYLVPSPGLVEVAVATAELGLDLATASGLLEFMQSSIRATAAELVARFTEQVSVGHLGSAGPAELSQLLERVRPLTRRTIDLLFAHEMERAQRLLLESTGAQVPPVPGRATPTTAVGSVRPSPIGEQ